MGGGLNALLGLVECVGGVTVRGGGFAVVMIIGAGVGVGVGVSVIGVVIGAMVWLGGV